MFRCVALASLVLAWALVAAPSVLAAKPSVEVFEDSGSVVLADCGGGVTLEEAFSARATVRTSLTMPATRRGSRST